jgi:hypothetical protein
LVVQDCPPSSVQVPGFAPLQVPPAQALDPQHTPSTHESGAPHPVAEVHGFPSCASA